ncbi:MAG: hypothetical protein LPK19_16780 [Hymenobacteraceae bacterium]|nr:hypothetical protein [Hymenobacteraceae bacterium]MDX5397908.1 hypothetical protein [Hymenobacteraceae bacterium]MDX5513979.1 hypothetical protein [Hymenobacteraceae bacterium]
MSRIFLFLLALVALASCNDVALTGDITIKGVVVDAVTQVPLDSAVVELYEDNDGAFMGKHLLKEAHTDNSGRFQTSFKYKEGPYIIKVKRNNYSYFRLVYSKLTNDTLVVDYENVDGLKKEQHFTLDMEAERSLNVHLKNTAPFNSDDKITLRFKNLSKRFRDLTETYTGTGELKKTIVYAAAGKYVPVTATITKNTVTTVIQDSVFINKDSQTTYYLEY